MVVVANEDAMAIAVEAEGNAVAPQDAAEQAEITVGVFGGEKLGGQDLAGGVVEQGKQSEFGAALFEPAMQAGIEQQHLSFAGARETAQAMSRSPSFARRAQSGRTQETTEGFAAEREAFDLTELLMEMMIVESGIAGAGQSENALAQRIGQAARAGTAAADVSQSRCAALPIARFETFDMPRR